MDRMDVEDRSIKPHNRCRLIALRKYSLAICALQALVICLFVYLLLNSGRASQDQVTVGGQPYRSSEISNFNYRIYSDASGAQTSRFLTDLYKACNLRRHDLRNGVACKSSTWYQCELIEGPRNQVQMDISSDNVEVHQVATVISTSKSGRRLHKERVLLRKVECKPQLEAHLDPCRFSTRLVVQMHQRQQQIIGWGGALTDSSVQSILSLTTNGTRRLLDDYFGASGLRFNMIRITIGGSDFSSRFYTNDDSLTDDLELLNFKLREEDLLYKIPLLKLIKLEYASQWLDGSSLKLFASMWSPPTWMKTNNHFNKGRLKGSIDSVHRPVVPREELYYNALADLKINFMLAYQRETGLQFWGLTVMNEPLFAVQPFLNFNTMIFPREDYANYVAKYLGPKVRQNEKLKHLKLIAHDDNRRYLQSYTMPILAKPETRKYIDGVATHSYADEAYDQLDLVYDKHQTSARNDSFFVLPTELCSGHLPSMEKALIGNWHRGIHYALDIVRSLQHSAAGWVDWNMVLDVEGGPGWLGGRLDAPVIVDKEHDTFYKSPMFYVLGQFSRYIPPKSVKLRTKVYNDIFDNQFEVVTFGLPNNEQLATIIINNNPYTIEVRLKLAREQKNSTPGDTYYSYICEPDSVSTIIYSNKL